MVASILFPKRGSCAPKGTGLLLLRLPSVANTFESVGNRGRCNHPGGHPASIGRNPDGTFCTAPLKVYPSALCFALAQGLVQHASVLHSRRLSGGGGECSQQLAAELAPFFPVGCTVHHLSSKDYYES